MEQCGVVWSGVEWCGVVWSGVEWYVEHQYKIKLAI